MLGKYEGEFHAGPTAGGTCAWLGSAQPRAVLWPKGYRVRFSPTVLIDAQGRVAAREGQQVEAGGGQVSTAPEPNACSTSDGRVLSIQSAVTAR
jgi:hypothetical protein